MAKIARERAVKERRERKAEKKRARKLAAAAPAEVEFADTGEAPVDAGDEEVETVAR